MRVRVGGPNKDANCESGPQVGGEGGWKKEVGKLRALDLRVKRLGAPKYWLGPQRSENTGSKRMLRPRS